MIRPTKHQLSRYDCFFLFGCSDVAEGCGDPNRLGEISGYANLIPGWARANSRFVVLREFTGKGSIGLTVFAAKPNFALFRTQAIEIIRKG
jgi:hypothetical protein